MSTALKPPLAPADYQRIFRIIKGVYDAAAPQTLDTSVFFSVAGAHLIESFYRKRCQPVAGAAFYKLDDAAHSVLAFHDGGAPEHLSSAKGFRCWVMCEGSIIDFMAPLFREALAESGTDSTCSRMMFQKPLAAMADSRLLMRKPGDFFMLPNVGLTQELLAPVYASDEVQDLLALCAHWYRKPPAKMPDAISIQRGDGAQVSIKLSALSITGVM